MRRLDVSLCAVFILTIWSHLQTNACGASGYTTPQTNRTRRLVHRRREWIPRSVLWKHCRNVQKFEASPKRIVAIYSTRYHRLKRSTSGWDEGLVDFRFLRQTKQNRYRHPFISAVERAGFYDLSSKQLRRYHGELAKKYGIYGFAFYHYWVDGKPQMHAPLELMLEDGEPNIPFCFIWANERSTIPRHNMSDLEESTNQSYDRHDWRLHFNWLLKFLKHPNYILYQSRPLIHILNAEDITGLHEMTQHWQEWAKIEGFQGLHFAQLNGFAGDTASYMLHEGMDSAVEYQPSYQHVLGRNLHEILSAKNTSTSYFRGISTSFDNSPQHGRAANSASIKLMHPASFYYWLRQALSMTAPGDFVYINAWNEWLEGAALEPSIQVGRKWLRAVERALVDEYSGYVSELLPDGHPKDIPLRPAGVPMVANSTPARVCIVVRTFAGHSTGFFNLHQTLSSLLRLEHQLWDAFIVNTDPAPFPQLLSILSEYNSSGQFHMTHLQATKEFEEDYDHPYALLDEAIAQHCLPQKFDWILATNGDNWYTPDALNLLDSSFDIILMNFYTRYMTMNSVRRIRGKQEGNCCTRLDEDICLFSNLKLGAVDLGAMVFNVQRFQREGIRFLNVSNMSKTKCPKYGGCHDGVMADLLRERGWSFKSHPVDICTFHHNSNPTSCDMVGGVWYDSLDPGEVGCYDYEYLDKHLPRLNIHAFQTSRKACFC